MGRGCRALVAGRLGEAGRHPGGRAGFCGVVGLAESRPPGRGGGWGQCGSSQAWTAPLPALSGWASTTLQERTLAPREVRRPARGHTAPRTCPTVSSFSRGTTCDGRSGWGSARLVGWTPRPSARGRPGAPGSTGPRGLPATRPPLPALAGRPPDPFLSSFSSKGRRSRWTRAWASSSP